MEEKTEYQVQYIAQTITETPEFLAAFAKAQAQFKPAIKETKNDHFGKKYADLNSVWDACREALATNDLLVMQPTFIAPDNRLMLRTRVYHIKGGYTESIMPVLADNMLKAQSMGSGLTYTRRYSLAAVLGIVVDDGDAEGATDRSQNKAAQSTQPQRAGQNTTAQAKAPQAAPLNTEILIDKAAAEMRLSKNREEMAKVWNTYPALHANGKFLAAMKEVGNKYPKPQEA